MNPSLSRAPRLLSLLAVLLLSMLSMAAEQSSYDQGKPFGYCNMLSRTDASATYSVVGGGAWTYPLPEGTDAAVITSNGGDMREALSNAIKHHQVVVIDGSNGPLLISSTINLSALEGKTIMGVNGATLVTQWQVTDEIKKMLDDAGVPQMNSGSDPLGGTLPNGIAVREEAEYNTRLLMLQKYGNEDYRRSGFFTIQNCRNIIVRNIRFIGPGSIDVGGDDPVALYHSFNVWVDHCDFVDGIDGNLDITSASDYNTVSWCTFSYTGKSYAHRLTNLIGSSEDELEGTLNTTLAYNKWGALCQNRMPMARMGIIHELNNFFDCPGAGLCVNCNYHSSILVEGNYFAAGVKKIFRDYNSEAYVWSPTNYVVESYSFTTPKNKGTVTVPYAYEVINASTIRDEIKKYGGATLYQNVTVTPTEEKPYVPSDITVDGNAYIIHGDTPMPYDGQRVICHDITMTYGNDGEWGEPKYNSNVPEGYLSYVSGQGNPFDANGKIYKESKKNPPVKGTYYLFTPTVDGTLTIGSVIFKNKALWVLEDGKAIPYTSGGDQVASGTVIDPDNTSSHVFSFEVKAGSTYHVFCTSSKMMFCGFTLTPKQNTGIQRIPSNDKAQKKSPASRGLYKKTKKGKILII